MRFPIKLNRSYWPPALIQTIPSATDPRILCNGIADEKTFTEAVSAFKFRTTFKLTQKTRFPLTILELASLPFEQHPVIVDIGASDGITSLDIMRAVPFEKYYVTDLNIDVYYQNAGNTTWFYDEKGFCILAVTNKWIVYPDAVGAVFPFDRISQAFFARAPRWESDSARLRLINPALQNYKADNFLIEKHNILEAWPHGKADLIIAANILNRSYFTASEIKQALINMATILGGSGRIAIIENRENEQATIFRLSENTIGVEKRVNGGAEIEALVLNSLGTSYPTAAVEKASEQV